MSRLRIHSFFISIDGFGAGPNQDLENPLGVGGLKVFDCFFPSATGSGGETKPGSGLRFCDSKALAPEIIQQYNGGE